MEKMKKIKKIKEKIIDVINRIKEMKELSGIKKIRELKNVNVNELARMAQNKIAFLVIASIGVLVFIGWFFMSSVSFVSSKEKSAFLDKKSAADRKEVQMDGTADTQFNQDSSQKALEEQQREIKSLNEKLTDIGDQMDFLQKSLDEKNQDDINDSKVAIQELQTKIAELEGSLKKPGSHLSNHANLGMGTGSGIKGTDIEKSTRGITTINFSYRDRGQNQGQKQNQSTSIIGNLKDSNIGSNS